MLPKFFQKIDSSSEIHIRKFRGSEDVSDLGAFRYGDKINFEVAISRRLGAIGVVMRICRDGGADEDITLGLLDSDNVNDIYTCTLDTEKMCAGGESGLFYYEFLIMRGFDTLFTVTHNNFDEQLPLLFYYLSGIYVDDFHQRYI